MMSMDTLSKLMSKEFIENTIKGETKYESTKTPNNTSKLIRRAIFSEMESNMTRDSLESRNNKMGVSNISMSMAIKLLDKELRA